MILQLKALYFLISEWSAALIVSLFLWAAILYGVFRFSYWLLSWKAAIVSLIH